MKTVLYEELKKAEKNGVFDIHTPENAFVDKINLAYTYGEYISNGDAPFIVNYSHRQSGMSTAILAMYMVAYSDDIPVKVIVPYFRHKPILRELVGEMFSWIDSKQISDLAKDIYNNTIHAGETAKLTSLTSMEHGLLLVDDVHMMDESVREAIYKLHELNPGLAVIAMSADEKGDLAFDY